jgi:hypothetical protein
MLVRIVGQSILYTGAGDASTLIGMSNVEIEFKNK